VHLCVSSERRCPRGTISSIKKRARKDKQWLETRQARHGRSFLQAITAMPEQDIQDSHEFNTQRPDLDSIIANLSLASQLIAIIQVEW